MAGVTVTLADYNRLDAVTRDDLLQLRVAIAEIESGGAGGFAPGRFALPPDSMFAQRG